MTRSTSLVNLLVQQDIFRDRPLVAIDAGCHGGLPQVWRRFAPALVAYGIDPLITECRRLQAAEPLPTVRYHARFLGLPESDATGFDRRQEKKLNPWARLSAARAMKRLRQARKQVPGASHELASPNTRISLDDFAREQNLDYVDVLKIDVDGADFEVLRSAERVLSQVLWVKIEVNFYGSAAPEANTFHNIDRYLRARGFALFGLTTKLYSRAALPAPFVTRAPAQTSSGAPYQGDAFYARDLVSQHEGSASGDIPILTIAKLAALFELHDLPDCAAELLAVFGNRWKDIVDPVAALDALASRAVPGMRYVDYMEAFERSPLEFRPPAINSRTNASLEKSNAKLEAANRGLQDAAEEISRQYGRLRNRLASIETSRTWRMTAPWRHLRQALAKSKRRR